MGRRKVFGLGFHRTGTTTLHTALQELGYRVVGMRPNDWAAYERGDLDELRRTADQFDGFRDMPWPLLYEWLDRTYPDARFVLTMRSTDSWLASCRGVFGTRPHPVLPRIYGVERFPGNEALAAQVYEAHNASVRSHFAGQPDRFLELDLEAGDGWEALCDFLGEPIPDRPFPHANLGAFTLTDRIRRKLLKWTRPAEYFRRTRDLR
ncbi:MAG TPA: sulfotransferase [Sphingomicrobium sp.]|nr:sulfotransferase [Sphingomicrobium sp.]